jgi:hypothetical protein
MSDPSSFDLAIARLDAWFDTLRDPTGQQPYGGPVSHWWQQSLLYTGPGLDWRYEGIIRGYLLLWQRTGEPRWLDKAHRAGDDLLHAQLANGHYPASSFEGNPASAGTPHEAAADLGLLSLAIALKTSGDPGYHRYSQLAIRNLRSFYIDQLWDPTSRSFRDDPLVPSFVPNKAATAAETFFALGELTGEASWAVEYALPNLDRILTHQLTTPGRLHGAIAQNSFGSKLVPKYMPYYIARCIPALVQGYELTKDEKYLAAAIDAMRFISSQLRDDGSLPPALYPHRQANHHPAWVAALGDVLRSADILTSYGFTADLSSMHARLLAGQDCSGAITTATGFAAQAGGKPGRLPEFRDQLHVAGWCDKAFHYLASHATGAPLPSASCEPFQADCTFQGLRLSVHEDPQRLQALHHGKSVYLWLKGEPWARQASPQFWLH